MASRSLPTILLALASILALAAPAYAAPPACAGGRYLLRPEDGQLIVGATARDAVTVAGNRLSIDSGCPADQATNVRVKGTRRGTRITASWSACGEQRKVRLVASITRASQCEQMTGVRRARRSAAKHWAARLSRCGDGFTDPGNDEACDGSTCPDGQACTSACRCPPAPSTTSSSSTSSTVSTTSTSATTSTSSSRSTSSTRSTSTSRTTSTSTSSTSSSSTSTSSLPVNACPGNEAGGPGRLFLRAAPDGTGSDLDLGRNGTFHNFPLAGGTTLDLCLSGCDASGNPACTGSGSTGPGSPNGETFGPPVPLLAANTPLCVVNRFAGDVLVRTANFQTGAIDAAVSLLADVYLTTNVPAGQRGQVCPQCSGDAVGADGVCIGGADDGKVCRVDGTGFVVDSSGGTAYQLSRSCRPAGTPVATLALALDPLGTTTATGGECPGQTASDACGAPGCTGECSGGACAFAVPDPIHPGNPALFRCQDRKGGLGEFCCGGDEVATTHPCFATGQGTPIARTGFASPAVADGATPFPASSLQVLTAVFCVPATSNDVLDLVAIGLPGPGTILLPMTAAWLP